MYIFKSYFFSFVHFGHGILSFYAFGSLDSEEKPIYQTKTKTYMESLVRMIHTTKYNLGLVVTLMHATLFEVMENSVYIIDIFRHNTGDAFAFTAKNL